MIDPQTYYLFLLTSLVLVLTPGPDTVLILSRTIATGTVAGAMTAAVDAVIVNEKVARRAWEEQSLDEWSAETLI